MEKVLKIGEQKAREMYPKASIEWKSVLEETFSKEFFQQKITDRVKSFEDAYALLGLNGSVYSSYNTPDEIAYMKLKVIIKALNEGWTPDWNDDDQAKWYPWFELQKTNSNPSGFRLGSVAYGCTNSFVGSRLCFRSRELAEYAAKQFEDLYKQFFTL